MNLLASLLAEIDRRRLDWDCVISTTTVTGYALARKKYAGRTVFYCPLDFSWAVRRALGRVRPTCLVLAELELWPNLIAAAREHARKWPSSMAGSVTAASAAIAGCGRWWRGCCGGSTPSPCKTKNMPPGSGHWGLGLRASTHRLHEIRRCHTNCANPQTERLARLVGFQPDETIFLAGSTQDPEESLAVETFRRLSDSHPKLRLVLVPRHADRFDAVAALLDRSGLPWQRRSESDQRGPDPVARILLVDAIGELGAWWGTARIAFVGGSLQSTGAVART